MDKTEFEILKATIVDLQRVSPGVYNIITSENPTPVEYSLDKGQRMSLASTLRHRKNKIQSEDETTEAEEAFAREISSEEKNKVIESKKRKIRKTLGNWRDWIKLADDENWVPFWPTTDRIADFSHRGYVPVTVDEIDNEDGWLAGLNPAEYLNPSGMIQINGHVLMKIEREVRDEYFKVQNEKNAAERIAINKAKVRSH